MTDMERTDLNRVLVLGGQGVLGRMIAEAFAAAGWTPVRAGRRPDSGADFRRVDLAEPETVEKALGEADLIVTTVPDERLVAERLVLERGGLLVNVAALPASAAGRLRREPGPAQGTVLMNAGIAHRTLTGTSRHHTTVVSLPAPFGRRRCLAFAESDGGWLVPRRTARRSPPTRASASASSTARCWPSTRPGSSAACRFPSSPAARPARRRASRSPTGSRSGAAAPCWPPGRSAAGATTRSAAAAAVLFAGSLAARGAAAPTGVLVPEELVTIGELRPALAKAGIVLVDERPPAASADAPLVSAEQDG